MSWKDRAISAEPKKSSWKDRAVVAAPEVEQDYSNQEVSQGEAFGTGLIQGSTMGTAPIASGLGGAAMKGIEGLGDMLGLTTDSKLEEEGFTIANKKTGWDGLLSEYYDSRDRMKGLQDASAKQHPLTTLGGNILGGAPMAGATGIKVAKNAGTLAKIAAGAKEGAGIGAVTGFGSGDAKMFGEDGSVGDVVRETADSAVGGGLMGGIIPGVSGTTSKVKNAVLPKGIKSLVPGYKSFEVGQKLGKSGYDVTEESVDKLSRDYGERVLEKVQTELNKAGNYKKATINSLDEKGIRVNFQDRITQAIDELQQTPPISKVDKQEKDTLIQALEELRDGVTDKTQSKIDINAAKNIQKMVEKNRDTQLLSSKELNDYVQDLVPNSNNEAKIRGVKQQFEVPVKSKVVSGEEVPQFKTVDKIIQQTEQPQGVPMANLDSSNIKLKDAERYINEINRYTGFGEGNPVKGRDNLAAMKKLAADFRELSDKALDVNTGEADINRKVRTTAAALNKAGIDLNEVYTGNRFLKDDLSQTLEDITTTEGNRKNANRFFEYMKEVDGPGFESLQNEGQFVRDANKVAKQAEGTLTSTGLESIFGPIVGRIAKVGNVAGKTQKSMSEGLTTLIDKSAKDLGAIAQKVGMSPDKAAQQFAGPLRKAAEQMDGRKRSAILYGLYQQPAFREMYEKLGENTNDLILPVGTDRDE